MNEITVNEEQLIKQTFNTEQKGWNTGNPELALSVYAPEFVGYSGNNSLDPTIWTVRLSDIDELKKWMEERLTQPQDLTDEEIAQRSGWFENLSIKGDVAIGVTQFPQITGGHRTLWMFKKFDEEWKITSFISSIGSGEVAAKVKSKPLGIAASVVTGIATLGIGLYLRKRKKAASQQRLPRKLFKWF